MALRLERHHSSTVVLRHPNLNVRHFFRVHENYKLVFHMTLFVQLYKRRYTCRLIGIYGLEK